MVIASAINFLLQAVALPEEPLYVHLSQYDLPILNRIHYEATGHRGRRNHHHGETGAPIP
jgi:hypothetical protein